MRRHYCAIQVVLRILCWLAAASPLGAFAADPIPRPEHPRPDRFREPWLNLNGTWEFEFDDADAGLKADWPVQNKPFSRSIVVPYPFQAKLSGIGDGGVHHVVWYRRGFSLPESFKDKRILLNFGAVDYQAKVWLNGQPVGDHRGGHVPFRFDITSLLTQGENKIVLRAEDTENIEQPRGKQFWEPQPKGIFYTRTSGIWQTVWIEAVNNSYISDVRMTPQIDSETLDVEVSVIGPVQGWQVKASIFDEGKEVTTQTSEPIRKRFSLRLPQPRLWSPEDPHLYDITFTLLDSSGKPLDELKSYFGMRKISMEGKKLLLNNKPYYQRLVLDQGYWPDGILTAPTDAALKYDVEMAKKFGFNGARKHQKVEDPRWLYWCDKLGFLVWGEMANAAGHSPVTAGSREMFESEWMEALRRDYSHPSIVVWTPFNETWGIAGVRDNYDVQKWVERVYNVTRQLDPTRLVCDNSGWDHVQTDIADYHDYAEKGENLIKRWETLVKNGYRREGKKTPTFFVEGRSYSGQPVVLSEYGGIGLQTKQAEVIGSDTKPWSYGAAVQDIEAYLARYKQITEAAQSIEDIWGFCYTQLTDVEHEVNGVMTYDRRPKLDPAKLAEINLKRR